MQQAITRPEPIPVPVISPALTTVKAVNVNFYYGTFQALQGINLDIPANQVTALIGPSGCGKSTFLRCINRMNDLIAGTRLEGQILVDGEDINTKSIDPVELRKRVGMVFQRPNPFPKSIFENVAFGPKIHGEKNRGKLEEIVETSLRRAALWDETKDKLKQSALALSGGQQQRLCIARALAVGPEILLMDEPASALDPNSTHQIEALMMELKAQYTVVIVTHNMHQATRVSTNTAFFYKGEMVEYGATEQIFSAPREKRTQDYVQGLFG